MTFTEIVDEIAARLDLTASADTTRIGRLVNQTYRKITTAIGLQLSRRSTVNTTATISSSSITFSNVEKILNIYNRAVSPYKLIREVTIDELREDQPYSASDSLTKWALSSQTADTQVIEMNVIAQTAFTVYADVIATAATLSGSTEPPFPESYHDILIEGVLMNEYKKSEKLALAKDAKLEYEQRLSDLKLWMALSSGKDQYQGKLKDSLTSSGSGGGSGSSVNGALSYTQTGLITFDRDPSAPFAVTASSAVVPNLIAESLSGGTVAATTGTFSSTLAVTSTSTFTGRTTHNGGATLSGTLLFSADNTHDIGATGATRARDFHLGRNALIGGTLGVTGVATFTAAPVFNGGITLPTLTQNLLFTDATYDIGASGATRPRDLFLSRNAVIGGTLGVTGVPTFTAQSVHNGGATFAGHLIATDATYDIGASGATRFRDLFLSRNAVVDGTLGVTGVATLTAQAVFTGGYQTGAVSSYINDTSNATMTTGLTINQAAADDEILAFKSSDVAHGVTGLGETDTWGLFKKTSGTDGGMTIRTFTEVTQSFQMQGIYTTDTATRSTAAVGPFTFDAYLKSGTSITTPAANQNIVVFTAGGTTRFILDSDGDSHQDVGTAWTNFDHIDDLKALDAIAMTLANPKDELRLAFVNSLEESRNFIESVPGKKIITFNDDGHHFANMSRVTMLHHGAIRYVGRQLAELAKDNAELRGELSEIKRKLLN